MTSVVWEMSDEAEKLDQIDQSRIIKDLEYKCKMTDFNVRDKGET